MGRTAKPWWNAERGAWYAWVDGRRERLAEGRAGLPAASRRLHELLAARDKPTPAAAPEVGALAVAYLKDCRRRADSGELAPGTPGDCRRRLGDFVAALGGTAADAIRPRDVQAWLDRHPGWGPTTRHDAIGTVKAIFRWARRTGLIEADLLDGLRKPSRKARREAVADAEAIPDVLAAIVSADFRDLCLFLWLTGCRPSEARALEARHVDWARAVAVLPEHKTRRRTGRARVIPLAWAALLVAARNAERHPAGAIFRNAAGEPWTKDAVNCQVRRLRARAGLDRGVIAYAFRHIFATRFLERTGDLAAAAAVLGHGSTALLATVYSHLDRRHDHLRDLVNGLDPARTPVPPTPPASPRPPSPDATAPRDAPPRL